MRLFLYFRSETRILKDECAYRLLYIDRVEITSDRSSRSQMFFKTGDANSNKAGLFESSFSGGGGNLNPPSYFKKN